jgi:hypothetical protein
LPQKLEWTDAQDLTIRRMRVEGSTWDSIAATLGISRYTTIQRGRRIGAVRPPADFIPAPEDPRREPLPAGHPRSWGAITDGTLLEGAAYPLPVFPQ